MKQEKLYNVMDKLSSLEYDYAKLRIVVDKQQALSDKLLITQEGSIFRGTCFN
ncbi:hypothetical protein Dtox_2056 [Desulfofarcimen acetoxidans DSM 771]|uniref:Uncharacterized protein n=1 Tax=Desulfofarcimen acetoxidans (strain ATCC 49208 / DSM 771 / KCTC 5769 / VKM B-1644 / 5575) TaxID=485916 RepID=C8VYX5_DESAS|nr:hypothetical protein [Desulfofarcimen acetoxidans]ACV62885.1 hypothetical protein Dtox_2056 [Desulfofarcimen acetoxidans DSM 771]